MAKLLYFALLLGVFHSLGLEPAFVSAYQEYNWDKITFKADLIVDYILEEKKNVKDLWSCNYYCMKSNECNSFNLHEFNHTSNQIKEKDCKLYKLEITSMETFCKNPITGFLKMEGFVDLWVDANVALCSTPVIRPDCCDSIEVYYNDPLEYTFTSIYGYYVRQEDLINGRPWYKNDGRSIWLVDDDYKWILGWTTDKGGSAGYAYLDNDGKCQKWKLSDGSNWNDAGNKVKVRCGYKPKGYGTSMCCSRIRVTLNGIVKDKLGGFAGTYQKASKLTNNRIFWNQTDGDRALWWDNINKWRIGSSSYLGSNTGYISSVQDSACPTSDNLFKYYDSDSGKWPLAPINSVSIQCV